MNTLGSRLPDGVQDVLPPDARELERLRREILDMLHAHGYDYVICPVFEYLDSLLVGAGADLELQTFTFTDRASGRLLGLRADLTSQALRIDAARMQGDGVRRLCYAGPVARAQPEGVFALREPQIIGAELFGAPGQAADAEVVSLMAGALELAGVSEPIIEIGHVGIVASLSEALGLHASRTLDLHAALHRKARDEVRELTSGAGSLGDKLVALTELFGDETTLDAAREALREAPPGVAQGLDELESFIALVKSRMPATSMRLDLAEMTGFNYHTGLVFAAYSEDSGQVLARGGRYDDLGKHYGRPRSAVGFDLDLTRFPGQNAADADTAWVPLTEGEAASARQAEMTRLRNEGWRLIEALDENETPPAAATQQLVRTAAGDWRLSPLSEL